MTVRFRLLLYLLLLIAKPSESSAQTRVGRPKCSSEHVGRFPLIQGRRGATAGWQAVSSDDVRLDGAEKLPDGERVQLASARLVYALMIPVTRWLLVLLVCGCIVAWHTHLRGTRINGLLGVFLLNTLIAANATSAAYFTEPVAGVLIGLSVARVRPKAVGLSVRFGPWRPCSFESWQPRMSLHVA